MVQIWWFGVRMVSEQLGGRTASPEHAAKFAINAPALEARYLGAIGQMWSAKLPVWINDQSVRQSS
jgi:hypothetical protein